MVSETAAPDSDWAGAGGMCAVVAASVVPGRTVPADQGKTGSAVVHAVSDNAVLSVGNSRGACGHGAGAVSVCSIIECTAGYRNPERTRPRDCADAGAVRN